MIFKKQKWRHPPQAIDKIIIDKDKEKVRIQLLFDKEKQNMILKQANQKMMKKDKRKLLFGDLATCRDFIFHLRRLHHLHNTVLAKNPNAKPLIIEDKY